MRFDKKINVKLTLEGIFHVHSYNCKVYQISLQSTDPCVWVSANLGKWTAIHEMSVSVAKVTSLPPDKINRNGLPFKEIVCGMWIFTISKENDHRCVFSTIMGKYRITTIDTFTGGHVGLPLK